MKVSIQNSQRKIRLPLKRIERDSRKALRSLRLQRAELSVLFPGQRRMRELNRRWRGVDATTDVLSFPLYDSPREFPAGEFALGDIAIDPLRAREQAVERGHTLGEELRVLLIHGILHLLGYDHEESAYQRRKMREKERELLELLRE